MSYNMKSLNMIGIPLKKISLLFLASFFLHGLTIPAYPQPGRWIEPVNISDLPYVSIYPNMAIGFDNRIHVVWQDGSRLSSTDMMDILYVCNDGIYWSEPLQLSSIDTTYSKEASIAVDPEGYPHVVWTHRAIFPLSDIYYTTRTDSGWTEPYNLTSTIPNTSNHPDIVIDHSGTIHTVWACNIDGDFEILHCCFDGNNWSEPVNVSNDIFNSSCPRIVVDSEDILHLTWHQLAGIGIDMEVYYSKYNGENWDTGFNVSNIDTLNSKNPDIAIDTNNDPHIVWTQTTQHGPLPVITEIYYRYYNGMEWSVSENIFHLSLRSDYPSLAINSRDIKCLLFRALYDDGIHQGDQIINYSFGSVSGWTYPDSVFDDVVSSYSSIAIDEDDILHACIHMGFNYYSDIGYTYFQPFNYIPSLKELKPMKINWSCYPNPFNSISKISFELSESSEVQLSIFNLKGELIDTLEETTLPKGEYNYLWNGTNRGGKEVSAGVYFVRLFVNETVFSRKIIFIK